MKSKDLSDLDTVINRLFAAVDKQKSIANTAKVNNVTKAEVHQGTRRFKATNQWLFAFGPAWSTNLNANKAGSFFELGYLWGLDPNFDLKLTWSYFLPDGSYDSARYTSALLGMNYFFDLEKHSPFLTTSIGYTNAAAHDGGSSLLDLSDDKAEGWGVDLGLGYKFFRTSSVNIATSINYSYLFDKTKVTQKNPGLTRLVISVYF